MNQLNLDFVKQLYISVLDDILIIFQEQFMKSDESTQSSFKFVSSQGIFYKANLIKALLNDVKSRLNATILEGINAFLCSAIEYSKGKYDTFSERNEISLVAYCYCLTDCFNYLVRKKMPSLLEINEVKYKNINKYVNSKGLKKDLHLILTELSQEIYTNKNKNSDVTSDIMQKVSQKDFATKKLEYKEPETKEIIIKEVNDNIKAEANKGELENVMHFKEQNINEKTKKNCQEFDAKLENDNHSEGETKENTMEDTDKDELTLLNSITDNNLRLLLSKILNSNKALKNDVKNLKEDIFELKNYFNLFANGRDITKSIVYYLYKNLCFSGDQKNDQKLSKIFAEIQSGKIPKSKINIEQDILQNFLYLDYFFNKFFNKIVHRDGNAEVNDSSENNSIKFISKYGFSTYFNNLILFTKKTMKDKGIQDIIKKQ